MNKTVYVSPDVGAVLRLSPPIESYRGSTDPETAYGASTTVGGLALAAFASTEDEAITDLIAMIQSTFLPLP